MVLQIGAVEHVGLVGDTIDIAALDLATIAVAVVVFLLDDALEMSALLGAIHVVARELDAEVELRAQPVEETVLVVLLQLDDALGVALHA